MTEEIIVRKEGRAGVLTLNRPKALNSLNLAMAQALTEALQNWLDDASVDLIIVTGAGDRAFCAGGDVAQVYRDDIAGNHHAGDEFFEVEYKLNQMIADYPKPYVAIMSGYVLGGGVGLSAHGSHRIVTDSSRVGMPETGIGFFPDCGITHLLARAPHNLGLHIGLTGAHINAADAVEAGLADVYVPEEELPEVIAQLSRTGDAGVVVGKQAPTGLDADRADLQHAYAGETVAEIGSRLREIDADWARDAVAAFERVSPNSLEVTLAAIREAADLSLAEVIARDTRLASEIRQHPDFVEGIRAQLIDKDRNPQWQRA